ncbi:uncharacterized protein [Asterias amurensis]
MAACFMIKNPQDASIYVTGLPVNNSWPTTTNTSNGATAESNDTSGNGQQPRPAPGSPGKRYCPVLAVTRRSFQGHLNPVGTPQTPLESPRYMPLTTDTSKEPFLRDNISKSARTFGKPVPPSDILKSRSAFLSSSAAAKSRSSFLTKSKVDMRTGFMRLLSRPTPGELDLKYHRESQENSAKGRRSRDASGPDPDKLSMTEIMRMLKSKSETEKRTILDAQNTDGCQELNTTSGPDGDGGNGVNVPTQSSSCLQKPTSKALNYTHERCDVVGCEPPLVSNRNREHKLRLQALYSQQHQCHARGTVSSEVITQGRSWRDHGRRVVDRISQRFSPPRNEVSTRVNNLSLDSLDDDGALSSCHSESCSDCWSSRSSDSGDRNTPRSTAALLLQQNHQKERHHCRTCTGRKGREHRRSSRPVRHISSGTHLTTNSEEMDNWDPLGPSHHRVEFAEYINIIHPMRPPANSPVSVVSEDEYELMNMDEETDQWSMSYRTKGASSISCLARGKVRIESDGESKAKINIFLPQMK